MMFSAQRVVTFNEAVSRTALLTRLAQSLLADGLVKQILEDGARALEAIGADVGQIVGDHVQARLLGIETGTGNPE